MRVILRALTSSAQGDRSDMARQQTVKTSKYVDGVGLHTGERVRLTLLPAEAGAGLRFRRQDVADRSNEIPAHALCVSTTQLGTNLTNHAGVSVATVEHFLAACAGLGLDNALIEIDGPELPILNGSSLPFCEMIDAAGLVEQAAPRRRLKILEPVEIVDGAKSVRFTPADGFTVSVKIDFPTRAIGKQEIEIELSDSAFRDEVAYARTFGFIHEVEKLRSMGLARGGSMENAIVIDGDNVLNPDGLQAPDEFVRHKLLDVIGDLCLAGGPIEGRYEGDQPGHALNNRLLRAVFADPSTHEWIDDAATELHAPA